MFAVLGVRLTRRMPNKPLFAICSGSPHSRMPRSHTDMDTPLHDLQTAKCDFVICENVYYMLSVYRASQWKHSRLPRLKKACQVRSNVKVMLTMYGIAYHEFLP